jgi:hypothetical protein
LGVEVPIVSPTFPLCECFPPVAAPLEAVELEAVADPCFDCLIAAPPPGRWRCDPCQEAHDRNRLEAARAV